MLLGRRHQAGLFRMVDPLALTLTLQLFEENGGQLPTHATTTPRMAPLVPVWGRPARVQNKRGRPCSWGGSRLEVSTRFNNVQHSLAQGMDPRVSFCHKRCQARPCVPCLSGEEANPASRHDHRSQRSDSEVPFGGCSVYQTCG